MLAAPPSANPQEVGSVHLLTSPSSSSLSAAGPSRRMSSLSPDAREAPSVSVTRSERRSSEGEGKGEVIQCNGCKQILEERGRDSVVVSFGNSLWHVDCFRCAKCHSVVEHDTNLLLLSDGSPVCENCSYICSVCKRPISNEAIVTGDESYHADCFRCRNCANRIEELIFAKTSQGIYCMSCHNERVTRSRRHAEAKRNKSMRKDGRHRERSGEKSGSSRSKDWKSGSQPTTPSIEMMPTLFNSPTTSTTPSEGYDGLQLPLGSPPFINSATTDSFPSPAPNSAVDATMHNARQESLSKLETAPDALRPYTRRTSDGVTSPTASPKQTRERRANSSGAIGGTILPSKVPQETIDRPSAQRGVDLPANPGLTSSDKALPSLAKSTSVSDRSHGSGSSVSVGPGPSIADGESWPGTPPVGERVTSPLTRPYKSSPALSSGFSEHRRKTSKDVSLGSYSIGGTGVGGLKPLGLEGMGGRANRRSGFYGLMMSQSVVDEPETSITEDSLPSTSLSPSKPAFDADSGGGRTSESDGGKSSPATPPLAHPVPPFSGDRPMSFYDPDTLLFLDAVSSPPQKSFPSAAAVAGGVASASVEVTPGPATHPLQPRSPSPDVEHLSPDGTREGPDEEEDQEDEGKAEALSREVRQSIMISRKQSIGMGLTLVEKLVAELDATRDKMKALQQRYNAMKRASRTVFEGLNLAREEYDREVAARREAEAQMAEFKAQMLEQASRLAAANALKDLQNESQQLKSSVSGLRRTLSVLTVERDMKVAEVETLQKLDTSSSDAVAQASSIPRSLSSRLEVIKQGYRGQIDELVAERDTLQKEIANLKKVRDAQVAEFEDLNRQSDALMEKNAQARRELEETRNLIARSQPRHGPFSRAPAHSPSLSNVSASAGPSPNPSATASDSVEELHHAADVNIATTRKFKWGKSSASKAVPTVRVVQANHRPSLSDVGTNLRAHNFQLISIIRPVRCDYCGDKLWGLAEVRCSVCGSYCHSKCAPNFYGCSNGNHVSIPEDPEPEGPSMFGNDLISQARAEGTNVPNIVVKCIDAVEHSSLTFEGIYRKTGGMSSVKMVQNCFDRGNAFDLHDVDRFNDISAVTSALKNYFRQLPNPLFTYELHEDFVMAVSLQPESGRIEALERVTYQLPPAHFHTLSALMRHLHRVHLASYENKMTPQNLGVVFGPTLLRSQNPTRQFSDMPHTAKVVELMVEHCEEIFRRPLGGPL